MKLFIVGTLLALATSLRIEKADNYFWETCFTDAQCPGGKKCGGVVKDSLNYMMMPNAGWCVEN